MITLQAQKNLATSQNKQGELTITSHLSQPKRLQAHKLKPLLNLRNLEVNRIIHQVGAQILTEAQIPTDRLLHRVEDLDKLLCYTD